MSPKSHRAKSNFRVSLGNGTLKQFQGTALFMYTMLTFLVVLAIYLGTKDWKGFTSPEEVDLGVVRVPNHACRRKHTPHRHHDY